MFCRLLELKLVVGGYEALEDERTFQRESGGTEWSPSYQFNKENADCGTLSQYDACRLCILGSLSSRRNH